MKPLTKDSTWDEIWSRCEDAGAKQDEQGKMAHWRISGFPDEQIAIIYQTADDSAMLPRTHFLVQKVFERFGPPKLPPMSAENESLEESNTPAFQAQNDETTDVPSEDPVPGAPTEEKPSPTESEIDGAFQLLTAIFEKKGDIMSKIDRARLLGAIALVCRSYGEETNRDSKTWRQMRAWSQQTGAQALRDALALSAAIPLSLSRHLHWLMADTLIGAVKTGFIREVGAEWLR